MGERSLVLLGWVGEETWAGSIENWFRWEGRGGIGWEDVMVDMGKMRCSRGDVFDVWIYGEVMTADGTR